MSYKVGVLYNGAAYLGNGVAEELHTAEWLAKVVNRFGLGDWRCKPFIYDPAHPPVREGFTLAAVCCNKCGTLQETLEFLIPDNRFLGQLGETGLNIHGTRPLGDKLTRIAMAIRALRREHRALGSCDGTRADFAVEEGL